MELFEPEIIDFENLDTSPKEKLPELWAGEEFQLLEVDDARHFKELRKLSWELLVKFMRVPAELMNNPKLLNKQLEIAMFGISPFFKQSEIAFQAEKSKEVQIDYLAEMLRVRRENPHLYQLRDYATIELTAQETRNISD